MTEHVRASPVALLEQARSLASRGEMLQAESLCLRALQVQPDDPAALMQLADLAAERDDLERAVTMLGRAHAVAPGHMAASTKLVRLLWGAGDLPSAQAVLERSLGHAGKRDPATAFAWLLLGELRRLQGQSSGAARAWHQALARAKEHRLWLDDSALSPELGTLIARARQTAREARREHLLEAYAAIRQESGVAALTRVDEAVYGLTGDPPATPGDTRQRPKFLYVPGLPPEPFLDPYLVPWAARLRDAFPSIQREALDLLASEESIPGFIDFDPGAHMGEYLGGSAAKPSWDAFFFYRRGKRYDDNHRRCPATSAVLESIDLFRIDAQAPEICFSFLAPQSTIMPHHGVSNIRLVMHLPLRVPPDCALNLVGVGEHRWREGELVLFDDTYLHEARNHSNETRIVLLMDCWNPHLSAAERAALTALIEAIGQFEQAL